MKQRNIVVSLVAVILTALVLSACSSAAPTEDANMKFTEIASTVQAQLTQNAMLTPSATPTLEVTATPTVEPATATPTGPTPTPVTPTATIPLSTGDNSKFISDVTVPDGTQFKTGEKFTKTWLIQNVGTTTWTTQYKLVYVDGFTGSNNTLSVNLPKEVKPGEQIEVSVNFTAPASNGSYTSWWRMYSANGVVFGDPFSVVFNVGATSATVAPTQSGTSAATATTAATAASTATTEPTASGT